MVSDISIAQIGFFFNIFKITHSCVFIIFVFLLKKGELDIGNSKADKKSSLPHYKWWYLVIKVQRYANINPKNLKYLKKKTTILLALLK